MLGGCYTLWVRYVNPESALGIPIMLDVLLMVIIGGNRHPLHPGRVLLPRGVLGTLREVAARRRRGAAPEG